MSPSDLWSRRMISRPSNGPFLQPLTTSHFSKHIRSPSPLVLPSAHKSLTSPSLWSSPMLYTPTEAATIILGKGSATVTATPNDSVIATSGSSYSYRSTTGLAVSVPATPLGWRSNASNVASWLSDSMDSYPYSPNGHEDDLKIEIDMACLATEMALHALDSDSENSSDNIRSFVSHSRTNSNSKLRPRLRLLHIPNGERSIVPRLIASDELSPCGPCFHSTDKMPSSPVICAAAIPSGGKTSSFSCKPDFTSAMACTKEEGAIDELLIAEKPVRKGRARMSQEKRRRLARRREREALLLQQGLAPVPASAPAAQTHFAMNGHRYSAVNATSRLGSQAAQPVQQQQDHLSSMSSAYGLFQQRAKQQFSPTPREATNTFISILPRPSSATSLADPAVANSHGYEANSMPPRSLSTNDVPDAWTPPTYALQRKTHQEASWHHNEGSRYFGSGRRLSITSSKSNASDSAHSSCASTNTANDGSTSVSSFGMSTSTSSGSKASLSSLTYSDALCCEESKRTYCTSVVDSGVRGQAWTLGSLTLQRHRHSKLQHHHQHHHQRYPSKDRDLAGEFYRLPSDGVHLRGAHGQMTECAMLSPAIIIGDEK